MADSTYPVTPSKCGVWMADPRRRLSASRMVAIDVMDTLGMDPGDFKMRDNLIDGIHDRINGMLDCVQQNRDTPAGG